MRVFLALDLPPGWPDALGRLQDALKVGRHIDEDDLHLTLVFLGDVSLPPLEELNLALEMLRAAPLWLRVQGLGTFGAEHPRSLHARVAPDEALLHLQRKLATMVRSSGIALPHSRFVPHVTLARFPATMAPDDHARLGRFLQAHGDFALPPEATNSLSMIRSTLNPDGARHELLERYDLA